MSQNSHEMVPESIIEAFLKFQAHISAGEDQETLKKLDEDFAEVQKKIIRVVEFRKDLENQ